MNLCGNDICAIGKKFWRFVEVYIFVMISTLSGGAIVKDIVSAKSKSKDKTLKAEVELFVSASAPKAAPFDDSQNEPNVRRALEAIGSAKASERAVEKGRAIEKGKKPFAFAASVFETRLVAQRREATMQAESWRTRPLNLLQQASPLRI